MCHCGLPAYYHICYSMEDRYDIDYFSPDVENSVLSLPDRLAARYLFLADRIRMFGPNLGMPQTRPMGDGIFELRLIAAEGHARVLFCLVSGRRVVMLHCFQKQSAKTPLRELRVARRRQKEIEDGKP
jgi:phage-related protein